ncbi:MAG TPA: ABC transporter substrate-binding protein, partial [Ruminococcaceae bacterium]|nr:ABC transporter substrate-binding protein [Oscillospiraceae bacterium]
MTDYLKSAFRNLGRKRVRTALTVLGIAIGVASVILVADISQSGIGAITDEMESL